MDSSSPSSQVLQVLSQKSITHTHSSSRFYKRHATHTPSSSSGYYSHYSRVLSPLRSHPFRTSVTRRGPTLCAYLVLAAAMRECSRDPSSIDPLRSWCMRLAFEKRRSTPADVVGSPRYSRAIRARWGRPPQAQHTCRLPRIVHH